MPPFLIKLLLLLLPSAMGFQSIRFAGAPSQPTQLFAAAPSSPTQTAEFEYQEMRALLNAMVRENAASRDLDPAKRIELENYARQVALKRPSTVQISDVGRVLPGTTWRLAFSTEGATLGDLPRDATVYLKFRDDTNMDYVLQFGEKTFGLNSLQAQSTWTADPSGLVTFVYDKITTDAFGFSNMNVGFFGLLKGRANYVETAYFDGTYWIERSLRFGSDGSDYVNVYVRDEESDSS